MHLFCLQPKLIRLHFYSFYFLVEKSIRGRTIKSRLSLIFSFLLEEISRPIDEVKQGEDERECDARDDVDPFASSGELGKPGLAAIGSLTSTHVNLALACLRFQNHGVSRVVMVEVVMHVSVVSHHGFLREKHTFVVNKEELSEEGRASRALLDPPPPLVGS